MIAQHILSPVVEQKTYNNNMLLQATRTQYRQRGNGFFAPLAVEGKIQEYPFVEKVLFMQYDEKGNVLNTANRVDLITTILWGYNKTLPIAKAVNAESAGGMFINEQKSEYLPVNATENRTSFITYSSGQIQLEIETNFWEHDFFVDCILTHSNGTTYTRRLCKGTVDFCGYAGPAPSVSFSIPAGTYTLQVTPSRSVSNVSIKYTYWGRTTRPFALGAIFYEGFEEVAEATTATPFAGKKYHPGDYTVPFSKSNCYVDYRYLEGGVWKYKKQPFQSNMTLTDGEAIDEVRVYPIKSLMTTYTYDPLIGKTSETDPNGRTLFYEYDGLGRLSLVRDEKRHILKKYCYNYAGQAEDCSRTHLVGNAVQRQTFTRSDCGPTASGEAITYTIPAGTYFAATQLEADQKALDDIALNGQAYANRVGKCLSSGYQNVDVSGYYTRNNCPAGQESTPLYLTVGANMFTSTLSQPDADNKAKEYAQGLANASGECRPIGVKLHYENDTPQEYGVAIYSNDGTTWYEFTIPAATPEKYTGVLGSVPPGIYNVAIWTINGQWLFRDFEYCGNFMSGASEARFYDVEINSSCTTIKTSRTY